MKPSESIQKYSYFNFFVIFVIVLISIFALYISPYYASNLSIFPDSVEYAISAHNYAFKGACKISYCNEWFPIRYPPWFSMFILAPSFYLFGGEIGNAIIPVFLSGILGVLLAYFIGYSISNQLGGILSALIMLSLPIYLKYSKLIMTDIPNTALILGAALIFIKIDLKHKSSEYYLIIAGIISACCAGLRPATYSVIIPFLILLFFSKSSFIKKIYRIIFILTPSFVVIVITALYNSTTFGSITRNGYHFWCPVPYDYPNLIFSFSNISKNFLVILYSTLPILCIIFFSSFFLSKKIRPKEIQKNRNQSEMFLKFSLITSIPIIIFHLLYFYSEQRFFIPIIALFVILAASELSKLIPQRYSNTKINSLCLVFLLIILITYKICSPEEKIPLRLGIANEINEITPDNAVVISSIDPIYLNFMTRDLQKKRRIIIPTSRKVEYASKLIAPTPLRKLSPPPENSIDHRNIRLFGAGAIEAIPLVATENLLDIIRLSKKGHSLFIDTSHTTQEEGIIFKNLYSKHFTFVKKTRFIYRLKPIN